MQKKEVNLMTNLISKRSFFSLFFFICAVFIFVSLISYNPNDPSYTVKLSNAAQIQNYLGIFGSYTSDLLMQFFGISSYIIFLGFFFLAIFIGFNSIIDSFTKNIFIIFFSLLFFVSFSLSVQNIIQNINFTDTKIYSAGVLTFYFNNYLLNFVSKPILLAVSIFLSFISLFLIFGISIKKVFFYIFISIYYFFNYLLITLIKFFKVTAYLIKLINNSFTQKEEEEKIIIQKTKRINNKAKELKTSEVEIKEINKVKKQIPPISLLHNPQKIINRDTKELLEISKVLEASLTDFAVEGKIININQGPVITMFEYKPAAGVKITKVASLSDDLALALGCQSIRIIAPIPGKKSIIGIEVPNEVRETVYLKELIGSKQFINNDKILPIALGKDIEGNAFLTDLEKMPHLLVAGSTGSGKSVFINTLICSILYKFYYNEVKLILVDPKMLELSTYDGIPHLLLPVVTDPNKAAQALKWAVKEMIRRYELLSGFGVRNIAGYNKKAEEKLPYIVIVIDELADLMMVCSKEVETSITRLAQMARASGIHLVLATQRPSVDVITGLIKANFPSRIAFRVSSRIDARTIMDTQGAEKLLGNGDMLFIDSGKYNPVRIHGAFVSDDEVKSVVDFVKKQGEPNYQIEILNSEEEIKNAVNENFDPLYDEALKIVLQYKKASISFLQRRLKIGYNRAANIIETMEQEGVVSSQTKLGHRSLLER